MTKPELIVSDTRPVVERYRYRGYVFTIERPRLMWVCHGAPVLGKGFSLSWTQEDLWASWTRKRILHKLAKSVDRQIRDAARRQRQRNEMSID